ncbi:MULTISPECIES: Fe-S cluster assembly protein NifU [Rhodopseudomonas]|uniref:Nitrogen fixation protein NifU n=1 Tax=Rhodopseudomonas palustris (strain DX-1) TaxID=652103 RepID=E6VE24_RHOPX|nr:MULTISPECIES: Fe-S cluster assembly protein NifU [Rhodopseudomonas]NEW88941.1 Fe-S cluster assembly protein NifU [Rhodopseudomonas sp. WA056]QDL99107.1 Fe-S cluster assembly protein NifU [Rhodopseudomonas palustris]
MLSLGKFDHHFSTSANAGPLPQANAVGRFGSIGWGDAVKLMLKVDPDDGRIAQARFQAFGCSSAIAASAALTDMITGKTIDEASGISAATIADYLGGLPRDRMYCAVMNFEALQQAIGSYRGKPAVTEADAPPVCKCLGVGQMMIERTIRFNRLTSLDDVTAYTKAAGSCSTCFKQIEALLARVNAEMVEDGLIAAEDAYRIGSATPRATELKPHGAPPPAANIFAAKATPAHLRPIAKATPPRPATPPAGMVDAPPQEALIAEAVEELRPHLQRDGGDCEFVSLDGNIVYVRLTGNCVGCQLSSVTLSGVQARLAEKFGRPLRVVPVS